MSRKLSQSRMQMRHATGSKLIEQPRLAVGLQLLLGRSGNLRNRLPCVPELLCDNITHVLEILEPLLQRVNGSCALCELLLART
jgi:hypothetical protein